MILTPRPTQTPSFRHRQLNFPATRTTAYSTRSVLFNRSRSISSPLRIRANQRPDQVLLSSFHSPNLIEEILNSHILVFKNE
jgi:hypothetical protein